MKSRAAHAPPRGGHRILRARRPGPFPDVYTRVRVSRFQLLAAPAGDRAGRAG